MEDWKGLKTGDRVSLHVDSRKTGELETALRPGTACPCTETVLKTGVLLSLNSLAATGGLKRRKARGQRASVRRQSYQYWSAPVSQQP